MNKLTQIILFTLFALGASTAHAEKVTPGPKGGRLLESDPLRAEFLVEKDRTVTIHFYDAELKPIPVTVQSVMLIAELSGSKTKIEFEKKGDSLASKTPLPQGNGYNVVVQLKNAPEAKVKIFRIPLNMEVCGGCKLAEYACICEGH